MNTREGQPKGRVPSYNFGVRGDTNSKARADRFFDRVFDRIFDRFFEMTKWWWGVPAAARRGARGGGSGGVARPGSADRATG